MVINGNHTSGKLRSDYEWLYNGNDMRIIMSLIR